MLVIVSGAFSRRLFDISFDRIIGHIIRFRLGNNIAKPAVVRRVSAAAFFYRNRKLTSDLCKYFSFCRIIFFFLVFDIGKL